MSPSGAGAQRSTRLQAGGLPALAAALGLAACASSASPRSAGGDLGAGLPPGDGPLTPAQNQNAPPPVTSEDLELPRVLLWCTQPEGPACLAAQGELGIGPWPAEMVPPVWLHQGRDLDDDCSDPDVASMMERLAGALSLAPGHWADRGGQLETIAAIAEPSSGSGCAHNALPGETRIHVQATSLEGEPRLFVRVWETGEAP